MRSHAHPTRTVLITLALVAGLAACRTGAEDKQEAIAQLRDADGHSVGQATFEAVDNGVEIHFVGTNLPPGSHGFHVHTTGDCEPPTFASAGDHFNPSHAQHGFLNPKGPHVGDLPNLRVGPDGRVDVVEVLVGATLDESGERSLLGGDGTALVVHAGEDDQMTDPTGESGDRIACGVIERRGAT